MLSYERVSSTKKPATATKSRRQQHSQCFLLNFTQPKQVSQDAGDEETIDFFCHAAITHFRKTLGTASQPRSMPDKFTHRDRFIQRFFHRRIEQVAPLLQQYSRSIRSSPISGKPLPAFGECRLINSHSVVQRDYLFISTKDNARRVFLAYLSKLPAKRVICFIAFTHAYLWLYLV